MVMNHSSAGPSSAPFNREPSMKLKNLLPLVLIVACATSGFAGDPPAELKYARRSTREETRKATLDAHDVPGERINALLEYQLDGDFPKTKEDKYYRIVTLPLPDGVQFEPGGIEYDEKGRIFVSTRIGDIWMIENALELPPYRSEYSLYASGLHEVLGLARRGDWLYATQRGEITRIKDVDGDDRGDIFEVVSDGWEIGGDYHEYAFGSKFDDEGNIWVVLCLTGSFNSQHLFRGWSVKVSADGKMVPMCSGIRSPGGIGRNDAGDLFYTDNQGTWNGTSILRHLRPKHFMGNPEGNKWYDQAPNMGKRPPNPKSGGRWHIEMKKIPELINPAVFFPHNKMGKSASGICTDRSGGKFGPFDKQMFVSDQGQSIVMRVFLEKVKGRYQGACIPFRAGFKSGNVPMTQVPDGSMFIGGTARGWGARGGRPFALERLIWTGEVPFEIHEMRVRPKGFQLTFTKPVDQATAADLASYNMQTYTYIYQAKYGSPEVDRTTPKILSATPGKDGKSVYLEVDGLQEGHIHELKVPGLKSKAGEALVHPIAYYTLFYFPDS